MIRDRLAKIEEKIAAHETANFNYFDNGIRLLELANSAYDQWVKRDSFEKAKLLKILHSNLILEDRTVIPNYRKPFDLIAKAGELEKEKEETTCEKLSTHQF